jgi:uncharacterized membrane protein YfcA
MFIAVLLKTLQNRSIANRNMKLIPIVSYLICLLEITVYGVVIMQGVGWSVLVVAIGASAGAVIGVWLADKLNGEWK